MKTVSANNKEILEEFRSRLQEKHKINLQHSVCQLLIEEMSLSLRSLLMSRVYDRVAVPKMGYFQIVAKPPRDLHVNLPHLTQETKHLPERYEIRFSPSEKLRNSIESY